MNNINLETTNKETISKTRLKKHMHYLQNLGLRLTLVSYEQLLKIKLPENVINEIENYKTINSHVAAKRQIQYIGKLISKLNESDRNKIINFFSIQDGKNKIYQAKLKKIEKTIEYLLNDDKYLTKYIEQNHNINTNQLKTLIRNLKKDKIENKPTKYYKLLYNLVKDIENCNEQFNV